VQNQHLALSLNMDKNYQMNLHRMIPNIQEKQLFESGNGNFAH